jgi:putative membrane protein
MMADMFASAFPSFTPHWEVWGLVFAIACGGIYVARVIGPKVVDLGTPVVSHRQVISFWAALAFMTAATVWPLHDIAEQRLYSGHMFQHLVLTMVVPPLLLLSCPTWLAELFVASGGRLWRIVRVLATPILAFSLFNAFNMLSHMQQFVNTSVSNGPFHFTAHVLFVVTALIMWLPVCGPWPELRLSIPGQMVYLFAQSILPTLPAAWLWLSHSPVYDAYDQPIRLWGITVMDDQAAAGLVMKVIEAAYLWGIIGVLFFRWAARHHNADREGLYLTERQILEWEAGERGGLDSSRVDAPRTAPPS